MGNLFDLIAGIGKPDSKPPALVPVENTTPPSATEQPNAAPAVTAAPTPAPARESSAEAASEPQRIVRTAATASPALLAARDQYLNHAMSCRACHAPTSRYCPTGAELRATYDTTPMELTP